MTMPAWANPEITKIIPDIRNSGEGQAYEFKVDFPEDGRIIGKSVAAFGTSDGGLILIGVRNDGSVAGLNEAELDRLCLRAQSLAEQVQPAVAHRVSACYDEGFIIVICVHRGQTEPVFYYEGKPYIRAGRRSRPAAPVEVKEKIWSHPSSAQRLRDEELKHDMKKAAWELSVKRTAAADAASAKSI